MFLFFEDENRKNIIPDACLKTDAMTLPANFIRFFWSRFSSFSRLFWQFFFSSVKWWTHVSSMVMNRRKSSALFRQNIAKLPIETFSPRYFCSIMSKRSTIVHKAFSYPLFEIPMRSTSIFNRRSWSTIFLHLLHHFWQTIC